MDFEEVAKQAAIENQKPVVTQDTTTQQNAVVDEAKVILDKETKPPVQKAKPTIQETKTEAKVEHTDTPVIEEKKVKPWQQPAVVDEWGTKLKEIGIEDLTPEKVYSKFDELKKTIPVEDARLKDPRTQKFLTLIDADLPLSEYSKFLDDTDYQKIASENPKVLYERQLIKDGVSGDDFDTQMEIFNEKTPYDQRQQVLPFANQLTNERNDFQQQILNHREQVVKQHQETNARNLSQIDSILDSSVGHKFNDNVDFTITPGHIAKVKDVIRNGSYVNPDGSFNSYKVVEDHMKVVLFDEMMDTATKNVAYNTRKQDFDESHATSTSTTFNTPAARDTEADSKRSLEQGREAIWGKR